VFVCVCVCVCVCVISGVGSTLGSLAMTCINELLAKNYVPQEFEDYLLLMFQQTFHLLRRFTKDTSTSGSRLNELDDRCLYLRCIHLICLIFFERSLLSQQLSIRKCLHFKVELLCFFVLVVMLTNLRNFSACLLASICLVLSPILISLWRNFYNY
jgi:hypothetical protein